jgi:hypothetical protein
MPGPTAVVVCAPGDGTNGSSSGAAAIEPVEAAVVESSPGFLELPEDEGEEEEEDGGATAAAQAAIRAKRRAKTRAVYTRSTNLSTIPVESRDSERVPVGLVWIPGAQPSAAEKAAATLEHGALSLPPPPPGNQLSGLPRESTMPCSRCGPHYVLGAWLTGSQQTCDVLQQTTTTLYCWHVYITPHHQISPLATRQR